MKCLWRLFWLVVGGRGSGRDYCLPAAGGCGGGGWRPPPHHHAPPGSTQQKATPPAAHGGNDTDDAELAVATNVGAAMHGAGGGGR